MRYDDQVYFIMNEVEEKRDMRIPIDERAHAFGESIYQEVQSTCNIMS